MEYLSRIHKSARKNDLFKFHPRCKSLQLNHLCFADDLMLFYWGEGSSAKILYDCLDMFAVKLGWTYCECQHINGEHEVHTLHKPRRYIPSQNHMAMGRRSLIAYKVCTPFWIYRCGITHPNICSLIWYGCQCFKVSVISCNGSWAYQRPDSKPGSSSIR